MSTKTQNKKKWQTSKKKQPNLTSSQSFEEQVSVITNFCSVFLQWIHRVNQHEKLTTNHLSRLF